MIPPFNQSGALPPFTSVNGPAENVFASPYKATITEFVRRYSHSIERKKIIQGLLSYRNKIRSLGITNGFQWIDGSFVEDVENTRGRPPSDVDIVTFAFRPQEIKTAEDWYKFVNENLDLFDPHLSKNTYSCDAYYVDLSTQPDSLVSQSSYWFGLFSHQRESYLWKGMIQVPLQCTDAEALQILKEEM